MTRYYIASPNPSARRSIISAVLTVLEAYKSAFRVQISNALAHTQTSGTSSSGDSSSSGNVLSTRTVDDLLDEIIVDALGFLGLYPLFLCVALPHIPMLPLEGVYGLNWGDCTGKLLSIRRRHLLSSVDALNQFHHLHTDRKKHSQTRSSSGSSVSDADRLALSSKAILRVFNADEERFLVDHPTEFWF